MGGQKAGKPPRAGAKGIGLDPLDRRRDGMVIDVQGDGHHAVTQFVSLVVGDQLHRTPRAQRLGPRRRTGQATRRNQQVEQRAHGVMVPDIRPGRLFFDPSLWTAPSSRGAR